MAKEKEKRSPQVHPAKPRGKPSHKDLEVAAYYHWLKKGSPAGSDGREDWLEVENRWRDNIVPENND